MEKVVEDIITDEIRNHGLSTSALVSYLDMKGIISSDDFYQYLKEFSVEYVKRLYPELFEKN